MLKPGFWNWGGGGGKGGHPKIHGMLNGESKHFGWM